MGMGLRRTVVFVGVVVATSAFAGCGLEMPDTASKDGDQPVDRVLEPSVDAFESLAAGEDPLGFVDDPRVEACVEQTMVRAYVGEVYWGNVWNEVGQDEDRLRAWCEDLAVTDPVTFDEIHTDWLRFEAAMASTAPPVALD